MKSIVYIGMNDLRQINQTIGLEEYMNAVLVREGVRPAMLLEKGDYIRDYRRYKDPDVQMKAVAKMISIADALRLRFPELKFFNDRNIGVYISRASLTEANIRTQTNIGRVLGFLCADDYNYVHAHPEKDSWFIEIVVHLAPGYDTRTIQLLVNVCRSLDTLPQMEEMAEKIYHVFMADPVLQSVILGVEARAKERERFDGGGRKKRKSKKTRKHRR